MSGEIRMRVPALNHTPLGCVNAARKILRGGIEAYPNRADASAQRGESLGGAALADPKIEARVPDLGGTVSAVHLPGSDVRTMNLR